MDCYEADVAGLELAWALKAPPRQAVVFYGSSSITLWCTLAADFPNLRVVNAGFGGSTLAACAWFFPRLVAPLQPRALVVYAGDNDLGDGQSPAQVLDSLHALLRQRERHCAGVPLTFVSIKPSLARWHLRERICAANELARQELANQPGCDFVSVYEAMLGPDGQPRRELYQDDGLHLCAKGYELWRVILSQHCQHLAPAAPTAGEPDESG